MGLREQKKLRARRAILDAAHDLFVVNDYDQTTMEEVAARAELAVGTLYNYFPSKSDLLLTLIADSDDKYIEEGRLLVADPPDDPLEALAEIMAMATEHCVRQVGKTVWCLISATAVTNADSSFGVQYELTTKKHEDLVVGMMGELQKRGRIRPDIDAASAAHYLFSMKSKLFLNFISNADMTIEAHRREILEGVRYFVEGLCTAAARPAAQPALKPLRTTGMRSAKRR